MELIELLWTDPRRNLAAEQYVFDCLERDRSYLLLWRNDRSVIVGKNQNTVAEINGNFVREQGIPVVRRLSGGGAVYHDLGNLNYSFITDADVGERIDLYRFCQPVAESLRSYGVEAVIGGRNDITVNGKKFSGNAQYIREHRVLHHGTILFETDLAMLRQALRPPQEKLLGHGIPSVDSRVTDLRDVLPPGVMLKDFRQRLVDCIAATEPLTKRRLTRKDESGIEEIRRERYDTWEWNYGQSPAYGRYRREHIEGCGTVELSFSVEEGRLTALRFFGDFFGSGANELSLLLLGCPCRRENVAARLAGRNVDEYIRGLTAERLAALLDA